MAKPHEDAQVIGRISFVALPDPLRRPSDHLVPGYRKVERFATDKRTGLRYVANLKLVPVKNPEELKT